MRFIRGRSKRCTIERGQVIPLLVADDEGEMRAGFPPAWCVVVRRNAIESQLFIIVGAYKFSSINGAFFQ